MRTLFLSLLCTSLACLAQEEAASKPLPPIHKPDLAKWKLEVTPELGGWLTDGKQELRIKLVDPKDPEPPQDERPVESYDYYFEEEGDGEYVEPPAKSAEELRQERLYAEELAKRSAWRNRTIFLWFNGETTRLAAQVGYSTYHSLVSQNGENRLEIWEPDSGKRVVRTWWASASRTRLRINRVIAAEDSSGSGNLEVLEPNGDLARQGRRTTSGGTLSWSNEYLHATPSAGTYTIRWTGSYRGGIPFRLVVEAVLDGGTDTERRWRFERLILPGSGPAILGTIDVEN